MYSLLRLQGLEENPKLINVGPASIPECRVWLLGPTRLPQSSLFFSEQEIERLIGSFTFSRKQQTGVQLVKNCAFSGRQKTRIKSIQIYKAALKGFFYKKTFNLFKIHQAIAITSSIFFCQGNMNDRPLRQPMSLLTQPQQPIEINRLNIPNQL